VKSPVKKGFPRDVSAEGKIPRADSGQSLRKTITLEKISNSKRDGKGSSAGQRIKGLGVLGRVQDEKKSRLRCLFRGGNETRPLRRRGCGVCRLWKNKSERVAKGTKCQRTVWSILPEGFEKVAKRGGGKPSAKEASPTAERH